MVVIENTTLTNITPIITPATTPSGPLPFPIITPQLDFGTMLLLSTILTLILLIIVMSFIWIRDLNIARAYRSLGINVGSGQFDVIGVIHDLARNEIKILPFKLVGHLAYNIDTRSKSYYVVFLNPEEKLSMMGSKPAFYGVVLASVGYQPRVTQLLKADILANALVKKGDTTLSLESAIDELLSNAMGTISSVEGGLRLGYDYKLVVNVMGHEALHVLLSESLAPTLQMVDNLINLRTMLETHAAQLAHAMARYEEARYMGIARIILILGFVAFLILAAYMILSQMFPR